MHPDHSAIRHLLAKKDAKARLIWWIWLLQEFNLKIKDKKGIENTVADHLPRIIVAPSNEPPITEYFSDEQLMSVFTEPWYTDIVNYLAIGKVPSHWTS